MEPLLSVIVPVYGVEAYLSKCVDSILSQTYENLEVILVDDGSPDGCPAICDRYAEQDRRVRVLHKENGGQSTARNLALDQIRGEYVTFVDSDDWIEPEAYRVMMEKALEAKVRLVCCGRYDVKENTGEKKQGLCPQKDEVISGEEMLRRMFTWQGCDCAPWDKIFAAELFEGIRFPSPSGSEDIAILYQLVIRAGKTALVARPFYNYLQRAGSTSYGQVSERLFLYPERTKVLYEDICRQMPQVKPEARFLRVRSLSRVAMLLDQADSETRKKYRLQHRQSRKELRGHTGFLLVSSYFGRQERIVDLLLAFGGYRLLRKLR